MSVLIRGMKMPTKYSIWAVIHPDGTVEYNTGDEGWKTLKLSAVSVPPHGRLIDADALIQCHAVDKYDWSEAVDVENIKYAPTIIPAEGGA